MTADIVVDVVREGLLTIIVVSAPPLIFGLVAGLLMSIFQTVTSIQEPTLAFVPKILAVLLALMIFGPFMITRLEEYFLYIIENLDHLTIVGQ